MKPQNATNPPTTSINHQPPPPLQAMGGELKRRRRLSLPLLLPLLPTLLLPLLFLPTPTSVTPLPLKNHYLSSSITIGIKTYACDTTAPALLAALLRSVRSNYPTIRVLIANDGPLTLGTLPFIRDDPRTDEIRLPLDAGISAGRNAMVSATTTPMFLLLDDDHLFDPGTDLSLLDTPGFDIIGLRVRNLPGIPELEEGAIFLPRYIANITRFENRVVELCVWDENVGPGVNHMRVPLKVDVLHNAFIARVDALKRVPWRKELKVNEHMTFFLDAKRHHLKVGYLPSVYVHHRKREKSACYEGVRGREKNFEKFLEYRDEFEWTKECYKKFPAYVRWHLNVEKGQYVDS